MDKAQEEKLLAAIWENTTEREGRATLGCPEAFDLAERFQVEVPEIGEICNREDIKIVRCQLGCFK